MLDTNSVKTAMYAKGQRVDIEIDLWHKRFSHNNLPRLQDMQAKQVVFGLPKFSGRKDRVCEACQLGKQHRIPFPNERNSPRPDPH